jgi:hypothetical protein
VEARLLAVSNVSFAHVPLLVLLLFDGGVNLHSAGSEEDEHDPAYTDISPEVDIEGINAVELSLAHGRLEVITSMNRSDWDIVEDILTDDS